MWFPPKCCASVSHFWFARLNQTLFTVHNFFVSRPSAIILLSLVTGCVPPWGSLVTHARATWLYIMARTDCLIYFCLTSASSVRYFLGRVHEQPGKVYFPEKIKKRPVWRRESWESNKFAQFDWLRLFGLTDSPWNMDRKITTWTAENFPFLAVMILTPEYHQHFCKSAQLLN